MSECVIEKEREREREKERIAVGPSDCACLEQKNSRTLTILVYVSPPQKQKRNKREKKKKKKKSISSTRCLQLFNQTDRQAIINAFTPGLNQRALKELFANIQSRKDTSMYELNASMFEIYNEKVFGVCVVLDRLCVDQRLGVSESL